MKANFYYMADLYSIYLLLQTRLVYNIDLSI
nr:MAG TPA: hypothetical protein [Crassvirales sp.]